MILSIMKINTWRQVFAAVLKVEANAMHTHGNLYMQWLCNDCQIQNFPNFFSKTLLGTFSFVCWIWHEYLYTDLQESPFDQNISLTCKSCNDVVAYASNVKLISMGLMRKLQVYCHMAIHLFNQYMQRVLSHITIDEPKSHMQHVWIHTIIKGMELFVMFPDTTEHQWCELLWVWFHIPFWVPCSASYMRHPDSIRGHDNLCQMFLFQRKMHYASQLFKIFPQNQQYVHHPVRHQSSQIPSLCYHYNKRMRMWVCYLFFKEHTASSVHQLKNK